jgi:hypothetical protein
VKGASDDHPVTYEDPDTKEKTTHGTADGRMACLHHCLTYGHAGDRGWGRRPRLVSGSTRAATVALAVSFGTHHAADRRVPGEGDPSVLDQAANRDRSDVAGCRNRLRQGEASVD